MTLPKSSSIRAALHTLASLAFPGDPNILAIFPKVLLCKLLKGQAGRRFRLRVTTTEMISGTTCDNAGPFFRERP